MLNEDAVQLSLPVLLAQGRISMVDVSALNTAKLLVVVTVMSPSGVVLMVLTYLLIGPIEASQPKLLAPGVEDSV